MTATYWHKQTAEKPLFPELLWSRPENKRQAGKLLIIGGNQHGFVAPAEAFKAAEAAGIGTVRMIIPDSLKPFVGPIFEAGELAPTTPSGSFSQSALGVFLSEAEWAEGVLIAGDLGRNSETAILLEKFIEKYSGQLTITQDALDYFTKASQEILSRDNTLLVTSFAQLQQLAKAIKFQVPFTFNMDLLRLVETLHDFSARFSANIIVKRLDNIFAAVGGQVSSTALASENDLEIWRVPTAAFAAVWTLQNPGQVFKAATTAVYDSLKISEPS